MQEGQAPGQCAARSPETADRDSKPRQRTETAKRTFTGASPADGCRHTAPSANQIVCGQETDGSATDALHRWIARHRRWQNELPRDCASRRLHGGAVRNGSRIQVRSFRTGVAVAVAEDRVAPTHPNSETTGQSTPLVDGLVRRPWNRADPTILRSRASTGLEKVGEWMDPSCTDWARMESAEPNPAAHVLMCARW